MPKYEIVLHIYLTCGFPYRISNVRMWISNQLDRGGSWRVAKSVALFHRIRGWPYCL